MKRTRILVVAAHADDEVLGCGGALAGHADRGDEVHALFMTNGVGARDQADEPAALQRAEAMRKAMEILGVSIHRCLDFPDNALDRVPLLEIAKALETHVVEHGVPDRVYTHHPGDLNVDHQLTHRAVMTCFRPQGTGPSTILSFEVLSSTGWFGGDASVAFNPNHYLDITKTMDRKIAALEAYSEEMRPWPHARSLQAVRHLAGLRGAMVGVEAAEAFFVERTIEQL